MPVINLEQGSEEWKKWRMSKITATDISVILGSNPFKKKLELWEEKLGIRPPQQLNSSMERGQRLEPEARGLAETELKMKFTPQVIESNKNPWLAVSLDGISDDGKTILEVKCTNSKTHLDAIAGFIPEYYWDQIQCQLLCTEADVAYYFSYRPEYITKPFAIVDILPDPEKHNIIIEKGYEFYVQMCTMNPPNEWKLNKKG